MYRRFAVFAAPGEGGAEETPEDQRLEITEDDDETPTDPVEGSEEVEVEDIDADAGDDEGAGDDAEVEAGGEQPAPRGNRAIGALRAERRRLADENARITRELDEYRRGVRQQQQQPVESPQQRAERLALLTPEDRIREEMREALAANDRKQEFLNRQLLENSDQTAFSMQCAASPLAKKLAPDVERRRAELIARDGAYIPRQTILTYILGERLLAQQGKAKPAARERQRQQQTRPVNSRSDVPGTRQRARGDSVREIEERFGDVPI